MSTLTEAPPDVTPTQQALYEMLTENTGRHMLDSGGAYGRNWERNQRKTIQDFSDEPETVLNTRWGLEITHNLFHWLDDRLDYEPEVDALFERWAQSGDRADEPWLVSAERFLDEVIPQATGIYGDGRPMTVNTYNGEDLLSQTIQYVYFELDDTLYLRQLKNGDVIAGEIEDDDGENVALDADAYVLLQIHGGCDVRGGYTRPRVFRVMEELAILDNARASLHCDENRECGAWWYTDDGYHFYPEGVAGAGHTELGDYPEFKGDESRGWARAALLRILHEMGEGLEDWGLEPMLVMEDGLLYCPHSGHTVSAAPY